MVLYGLPGVIQVAWDTQLAQPIGNKWDSGQLLHELLRQLFVVHQHLDHRTVSPVPWNAAKPAHQLPAIQQRSLQQLVLMKISCGQGRSKVSGAVGDGIASSA